MGEAGPGVAVIARVGGTEVRNGGTTDVALDPAGGVTVAVLV